MNKIAVGSNPYQTQFGVIFTSSLLDAAARNFQRQVWQLHATAGGHNRVILISQSMHRCAPMTTNGSDSHSMETGNNVMILSVTDPSEQPLKGPQMVLISVVQCEGTGILRSLTKGNLQPEASE